MRNEIWRQLFRLFLDSCSKDFVDLRNRYYQQHPLKSTGQERGQIRSKLKSMQIGDSVERYGRPSLGRRSPFSGYLYRSWWGAKRVYTHYTKHRLATTSNSGKHPERCLTTRCQFRLHGLGRLTSSEEFIRALPRGFFCGAQMSCHVVDKVVLLARSPSQNFPKRIWLNEVLIGYRNLLRNSGTSPLFVFLARFDRLEGHGTISTRIILRFPLVAVLST